jgi:small subunit ribosomal protein S17
MADEEKNETTEETPEAAVEETPAAEVEETPVAEEAPAVEEAPVAEEAPAVEDAPVAEEVSDTPEAEADATASEEVSDTSAPAAPVKKQRSEKHVPRSARRTRTKLVREKPATRKPITRTEKPESELGRRQERRGVVVSDKGDKTIIVKVDVIKSHPKYKKVIRRTAKFHAHDEANTAGIGDTVRIVETRPLSKTKRWRLAEIVEKAR